MVLFVRLRVVIMSWAFMTPKGRDSDGPSLPSGGGYRPAPCNFTTPNTFFFLLIRTSFPSFIRSDSSFSRVSQITMSLVVFAKMMSVFNFSAKCVVFVLGWCVNGDGASIGMVRQ